jgi:hypothetical protein
MEFQMKIEMQKLNNATKILSFILAIISLISVITFIVNFLYSKQIENLKSELQLQSANYNIQKESLQLKIDILENKLIKNSDRVMNEKLFKKYWLGTWLTHYENGFQHEITFQIVNEKLIGKYELSIKKGEIIINKISENFIEAIWIQESTSGKIEGGELKFCLNNNKSSFTGNYTRFSENKEKNHSWNGSKKE